MHDDNVCYVIAVILKDAHYMLYYLAPAIQTRMLVTFDEDLNPLPVTVRVGQVIELQTCMHIHTHTHTHTHAHTHTRIYTRTSTRAYIHIRTPFTHVHTHTHTHRLWTWWDKQVNPKQSQGSKLTAHLYCWAMERGQS